mmetsp:Transcript_15891/g.37638  ORF Transcript_15891/g.37638 Transcript_15891/m.37638 type:complete len:274 (+) Transcript_15891:478-1299(+)
MCQRALTRHSWGGGALERGHGAPLEPFAQLVDARGGVGTLDITNSILVEAAELVVGQIERLQRGVALEALRERSSCLRAETVEREIQLLEHAVLLDAARYDDGGGNAEMLAREVDLLGWLRALELVDLKRVALNIQIGDLRLVENGSQRNGALGSDGIGSEIHTRQRAFGQHTWQRPLPCLCCDQAVLLQMQRPGLHSHLRVCDQCYQSGQVAIDEAAPSKIKLLHQQELCKGQVLNPIVLAFYLWLVEQLQDCNGFKVCHRLIYLHSAIIPF